jgi:nitroreductase
MLEMNKFTSHFLDSAEKKRVNRRSFLKGLSIFSLMAFAGSSLLQACARPTSISSATPATVPAGLIPTQTNASAATSTGMAVVDALKNRKSTNAFQTQPLTKDKLLEMLWAAWGINRPDSGKRTAPSAMNAQEIDIYVLLSDGAYIYDARANQIVSVSDQDLRPKQSAQGFMKDAPVHLIFVADYTKFRSGPQSQMELYSSCHTGFIGQNVYLYCASQGLGAHFYASVDRDGLKDKLKLRGDQAVIFGQAVGYPKE